MIEQKKYVMITYAMATGFFSLRRSDTTSKGSKSYLCPTPHCVKSALINQYAQEHNTDELVGFFEKIQPLSVYFCLPSKLVVNQTFYTQLKSKRKKAKKDLLEGEIEESFDSTIMYKEYVYYDGDLTVIFDVSEWEESDIESLIHTLSTIRYLGKKDSLISYKSHRISKKIPEGIVIPLDDADSINGFVIALDDYYYHQRKSSKEYLEMLKKYSGYGSSSKRQFIPYLFPYRITASSRRYTLYQHI